MATFHRLKRNVGEQVLTKFNNRCVNCGSDENLCIHHKEKMKPTDVRYNDIDNLTILCRKCHMAHHRREGDIVALGIVPNPNGRRGNNPPVICKIEGCNRSQHGKSLCKKHYEYSRRNGLL